MNRAAHALVIFRAHETLAHVGAERDDAAAPGRRRRRREIPAGPPADAVRRAGWARPSRRAPRP